MPNYTAHHVLSAIVSPGKANVGIDNPGNTGRVYVSSNVTPTDTLYLTVDGRPSAAVPWRTLRTITEVDLLSGTFAARVELWPLMQVEAHSLTSATPTTDALLVEIHSV